MSHEVLVAGTLVVDVARRHVTLAGEPVSLPPKAFELLLVLLREPGVVHTREALFERLWPGQVLLDANLTTTLSQLKRALDDSLRARFRTVPRVGYAFDGEVERRQIEAAADGAEPETTRAAPAPVTSRGTLRYAGAALALLLVGMLAPPIWRATHPPLRPIVVLGEIVAESAGAGEWVGEAVRDALRRHLAARPEVRVVDRADSVGAILLAGQGGIAPSGADYALSARYAARDATGTTFDVTLRLTPLAGGDAVEARASLSALELLSGIDRLAGSLTRRFAPAAPVDPAPIAPLAVSRYGEALERLAASDYRGARSLLEDALAASPGFAVAELRLAEVLRRLGYTSLAASHYRSLAGRPEALGPEALAEAAAHADALGGRRDAALSGWRRLAKNYPDEPRHRVELAQLLAEGDAGERREAIALLDALAEPPLLPEWEIERRLALGDALARAGELARARAELETAFAKAEAAGLVVLAGDAALQRGTVMKQLGEREAARASYESARAAYRRAGMRLGEEAAALNLLVLDIDRDERREDGALDRGIEALRTRALQLGAAKLVAQASLILADRHLFAGDGPAAERAAREALTQLDELGQQRLADVARLRLAHAWKLIGKVRRAEAAYRELDGRFAPGTPDHWMVEDGRVDALLELGDLDSARAIARKRIASEPLAQHADLRALAQCALANVEYQRGAMTEALAALDGCLAFPELEQRNPMALVAEIDFAAEAGDFARARRALTRVAPLVGGGPDRNRRDGLDVALAAVLLRLGAVDDARRLLAGIDAARLSAHSPHAARDYHLLRALLAGSIDGDRDRARAHVASARGLEPGESLLIRLGLDLVEAAQLDPVRDGARRQSLVEGVQADSARHGLVRFARLADALATELANRPDDYPGLSWIITPAPELVSSARLVLERGQ